MTRREREELVESLLWGFWPIDNRVPRYKQLPGQFVSMLPDATRRKLAELTAADFQHRLD